jgi:hypothetical protein
MAAYTAYVALSVQRGDEGVILLAALGQLVDSNGVGQGGINVAAPFTPGDDYATRLAAVEAALNSEMDPDTATIVVITDTST